MMKLVLLICLTSAIYQGPPESSLAQWFYIDDFFGWVYCKFVNCDQRDERIQQTVQNSKMVKPSMPLV